MGGQPTGYVCRNCGVFVELLQQYPLDIGPAYFHVDGRDPYRQCELYAVPSEVSA